MDAATQARICSQASKHVPRRTENVDSWVITNCHLLVFNVKHLNGRLF